MTDLLWLIPVLPLLGALLNGVFLKGRLSKGVVAAVACGSVVIAILIAGGAVWGWAGSGDAAVEQSVYSWIPAGLMAIGEHGAGEAQPLAFEMGFRLDALSAVMLFVVLIVGFLIHVYSVGYMAHEGGFQRYFAYLNLFMGAMLLLVLGNNYLVMFVGWEGVGLCSYLLIGFYFDQEFPPYAGRKAFIVNRIGDFAFLVGLFALVSRFGTLTYGELFDQVAHHPEAATEPYLLGLSFAGFVTLCLFVGAMGKSAQIPLYVWLPDAMAGPTPVSALIHAATMVTAGVYMMARTNVLYELAPEIGMFVAVVGAVTAIFAATIGLAQTDIKKVMAYSTVSQLGYMFLAAGCGAYGVAVFHLGTHAFFKALLFLGSGSVIHAMSGEQDIRKMGGLRKVLPTTYWTFLVGTLAIAGVPGLAGFFSKDQILAAAWGQSKLLWVVGLITAGLTACYMFRLVFLTFSGEFRGTEEQRSHLHESPASMTVPLTLLAIGSIFAGYLGLPRLGEWNWNWLEKFMAPVWVDLHHGADHGHHASLTTELVLMGASVLVAGLGIWIAWRIWGKGGTEAGEVWARRSPALHRLLVNKYYVDELYDATVVRGTTASARSLFRFDAGIIDGLLVMGSRHLTVATSLVSGFFDKYVVDGLVNLVGWILQVCSRFFRKLQTGLVSQYALVMAVGVFVLVCFYVVFRVV
jgi:NADH-quinone oxidoreductase subunit L